MRDRKTIARRRGPCLLLVVLAVSGTVRAHEIPTEAVARLLARPSGASFQVLVRVPMSSMRDLEVPEFGPGYLDVERLAPQLAELSAQWLAPFVQVFEDGELLPMAATAATQISIPSDRSFSAFEEALAHVRGPLPGNSENLVWGQVLFDVLLEYPIRSERAAFSIHSRLDHLADNVLTALQFQTPEGVTRAYQFAGDPGLLPLDPSWLQAAWRFVQSGFLHILDGVDHLLFLFCLVVPLRRLRSLVWIVTAFTVAHSFTLIASAMGLAPDALWFPPLVETIIAASILYMALENIVGAARRRWVFAMGFGLVHGFGFAFALRETLQFAGSHVLTSLLAFNVGVELGQLFVLLLLAPILAALFRFVLPERIGTIILSALAAHVAWGWMAERGAVLGQFSLGWSPAASPYTWLAGTALVCAGALAAAHWRARSAAASSSS